MRGLPSAIKISTHLPSAKWVKCWVPSSASYKRAIDGRYPSTMISRRMLKPVFMSSRYSRRRGCFPGELKDFHSYFSDIAQCTFVADDDVTNVRACRAAWYVFNACYGAISQYCFQTNDHIFDCAVECGELLILRVATKPPICASGFDCGECPVV